MSFSAAESGRVLGIDLGPGYATACLHGRGVVGSVAGQLPLPTILADLSRQVAAVGEPIAGAVVSTPVGLTLRQRLELEATFAEACLPLLRTVSAPVVMSLAMLEADVAAGTFVMVDLRGSGCDLAAIQAAEGVIAVQAVQPGRVQADAVASVLSALERLEQDQAKLFGGGYSLVLTGAGVELVDALRRHRSDVRGLDDAVVRGLSRLAGKLEGLEPDLVLVDVQGANLSVLLASTSFARVLERDTPVPTARTKTFFRNDLEPPHVDLHLWSGEPDAIIVGPAHRTFGEYQASVLGVPVAAERPGQRASVAVTFDVDARGLLRVTTADGAGGTTTWPLVVVPPWLNDEPTDLPCIGMPYEKVEATGRDFAFLEQCDPEQVAALLAVEDLSTAASVLGAINPGYADMVLQIMPAPLQESVINCLQTQAMLAPDAAAALASELRQRLGEAAKGKAGGWWQRALGALRSPRG